MIKIESDGTILINRGDSALISLTGNNETYQFKENDEIVLRVFEKNGYTKEPLLEKKIIAEEEKNSIDIKLNEEDTLFSPEANKGITYWYSISLNENVLIGYDDNGAKKLVVYPAKGGKDE